MGVVRKVFVVMLCMNLFLMIYMPDNASATNMVGRFVSSDGSIDGTDVATEIDGIEIETDSAVVGSDTLSIVSSMRTVWNAVDMILTYLFAPVVVFSSIPNVPTVVLLLLTLPNIIILSFGTISFIRGYDW